MVVSEQIFRLISQYKHPLIDRAMAEALPTADPLAQQYMVQAIFLRCQRDALRQVIEHYHTLPAELRKIVHQHLMQLKPIMPELARNGESQAAVNLIELIRQHHDAGSARTLNLLLARDHRRIRQAAGQVMLELTETAMRIPEVKLNPERELLFGKARRMVCQSVVQACRHFDEHRQRAVLLAAFRLGPRVDRFIWAALCDELTGTHRVVCVLIENAEHELVRRYLLDYAACTQLSRAALTALQGPHGAERLAEILERSYLLYAPAVRRVIERLQRKDHLIQAMAQINQWPGPVSRRLPIWAMVLRLPRRKRIELLGAMLASDDPMTRLASLRALMTLNDDASMQWIAGRVHDPEPSIARIAFRFLLHHEGPLLDQVLSQLDRLPQALQVIAPDPSRGRALTDLWERWPELDSEQRQRQAHAALRRDPELIDALAQRMQLPDRRSRLRSIEMVRAIGRESELADALIALSNDPDGRVAAEAVWAMGGLADSDLAVPILRQSMHHPIERVRANAIEALEELGCADQVKDELMTRTGPDAGNRERANALKALMAVDPDHAMALLRQMLDSEDRAHRLSALWVIATLVPLAMRSDLQRVIETDPNAKVRIRAKRAMLHFVDVHGPATPGEDK